LKQETNQEDEEQTDRHFHVDVSSFDHAEPREEIIDHAESGHGSPDPAEAFPEMKPEELRQSVYDIASWLLFP